MHQKISAPEKNGLPITETKYAQKARQNKWNKEVVELFYVVSSNLSVCIVMRTSGIYASAYDIVNSAILQGSIISHKNVISHTT